MAQEIKNTFLKSKMNKDLDDRILPNGEYRDARNISVGRSEDNDVGALENIIGNALVTGTDLGNGLTIIGIEADDSTDRLFVFLTDYEDPNISSPTNAPIGTRHYIYSYNNSTKEYTRLVQGEFLNFSTTNRIVGINLIENLLFWTDNRNQPRKINVNLAVAFEPGGISTGVDYYTQEHQISVAKYNPYEAIQLYNRVDLQANLGATTTVLQVDGDRSAELIQYLGATVVSSEAFPPTQGIDYVKVVSVISPSTSGPTSIIVSPPLNSAPTQGQYFSLIKSTMSNKNSDDQWPGDPDYLEDKFVRFSYRFKFDDNEYSLMAPFTQIAYIPKQNGYFVNGDEDSAYRSTIVDFMENLVQNIGLIIPLPTSANKMVSDYKISALEVLFRESDGLAVKVLDSISVGKISGSSGLSNYYTYEYQSRKPYRTLPEAQTVRVYDKVPVRALAQETSGNRIIYGNFRDQHTPPANINYNCRISTKSNTGAYNNWIEYPNHSVKRNRNYQVGFVLADKFGRQSPVLLSSVDLGTEAEGEFYSGSTIYSPYDLSENDTDIEAWFGDAIQVLVNEPITSQIDLAAGTPGLYAIKQQYAPNTGEGFAIAAWNGTFITNSEYTFRQDGPGGSAYPNNQNIPRVGDYMRGAYTDFVKVTAISGPTGPSQYTVTTDGRVNDVYLRANNIPSSQPDLKFTYTINDLGWYSYKIVVKQTEQDYYNVYLPGILNGYPGQSIDGTENGPFPGNELNLTAHTVLFNDNINKIPRDLKEVGEQDKQFRSSVTLYGRVTNLMNITDANDDPDPGNKQYYARLDYTGKNAIRHTATTIATAFELDMAYGELSKGSGSDQGGEDGVKVFYQIDSDPLIARISTTEKGIGWDAERTTNPVGGANNWSWNMQPFLAVYETAPVESLLDIYWETTSEGLIVDLNTEIASSNTSVAGFENLTWEFREDVQTGEAVTGWFRPINNEGQSFVDAPTGELVSATNGLNADVDFFELVAGDVGSSEEGEFQIRYTGPGIVFLQGSSVLDVYAFVIRMNADGIISNIPLGGEPQGFGALENVAPSFGFVNDIVKTRSDATLIPPATFAGSVNGTGLGGSARSQQLVYTFYATGGGEIPDNWTMDPVNGKMTQAVPDGGDFLGNPFGVYDITIRLTDANAETPTNTTSPYTSLFYEQEVTIKIDFPKANTTVLSDSCVLAPTIPGSGGTNLIYSVGGDITTGGFFPTNKIYYIAAENNSLQDFITDGIDFPDGDDPENQVLPAFRIGTTAHLDGTIAATFNAYAPGGNQELIFEVPDIEYYYRVAGGDSNQWINLPRSLEQNRVGNVESSSATSLRFWIRDLPRPTSGSRLYSESLNSTYIQAVRAFDYDDFNTQDGIEYAFVVKNFRQVEGDTSGVGGDPFLTQVRGWFQVDDLHYPLCVPWQGNNLVELNGGFGNYFKHIRSSATSASVNTYVDLTVVGTDNVYSRTPYGDYVKQFYTDTAGLNIYKPAAAAPYINTTLDTSVLTLIPSGDPLPQWVTLVNNPTSTIPASSAGIPITLQWSTGYSSDTGLKLQSLLENSGVSSIQVSNDLEYPLPDGTEIPRISKGTARYKVD